MIVRLRSHYAIGLLEGPSAIASSVHTPFFSLTGPWFELIELIELIELVPFMQESLGNSHFVQCRFMSCRELNLGLFRSWALPLSLPNLVLIPLFTHGEI